LRAVTTRSFSALKLHYSAHSTSPPRSSFKNHSRRVAAANGSRKDARTRTFPAASLALSFPTSGPSMIHRWHLPAPMITFHRWASRCAPLFLCDCVCANASHWPQLHHSQTFALNVNREEDSQHARFDSSKAEKVYPRRKYQR
jgi:hypothetical protein